QLVGPGLGLEVVSSVNGIPKGSRLAVSTNLLAALIAACMRATGQARVLTGPLSEGERRLVAARAILGEWLGGSGGGWQDSGGVWPGMKLITGAPARDGDPELGTSRGRLLPNHRILEQADASHAPRQTPHDPPRLIHRRSRERFRDAFQGFWMLGGMSGGGMGFIFDPRRKAEAQGFLQDTMSRTRRELQHALPFAMEPVVYDFAINPRGTWAELNT